MTRKSAPPPPPLNASIWANTLLHAFKQDSVLGSMAGVRTIDAKDHWGPTSEDFSEAVAWMHLLGLRVSITIGTPGENIFWVSRRGCTPWKMAACAPGELIAAMKTYAEDNPARVGFSSDDVADSLSYASILNAANKLNAMDVPGEDRYLIVHPSLARTLIDGG